MEFDDCRRHKFAGEKIFAAAALSCSVLAHSFSLQLATEGYQHSFHMWMLEEQPVRSILIFS